MKNSRPFIITLALLLFCAPITHAHEFPPEVQKLIDEALVHGGDAQTGEMLYKVQCAACHGIKGIPAQSRTSDTPYLSGQTQIYLLAQMALFKTGNRNNPMMVAATSNLTAKDMADIKAYLLEDEAQSAHCQDSPRGVPIPSPLNHVSEEMRALVKNISSLTGNYEKGMALANLKREFSRPDGSVVAISCADCHGQAGIMPEEYREQTKHPDLAALGTGYMIRQMASFKTHQRQAGPMELIVKGLTNQDLADLALYYSKLTHCQ